MTEDVRLNRINELARLSRERELTAAEKEEQGRLRREFIELYRAGLRAELENISFLNEDGTITPVIKKENPLS